MWYYKRLKKVSWANIQSRQEESLNRKHVKRGYVGHSKEKMKGQDDRICMRYGSFAQIIIKIMIEIEL